MAWSRESEAYSTASAIIGFCTEFVNNPELFRIYTERQRKRPAPSNEAEDLVSNDTVRPKRLRIDFIITPTNLQDDLPNSSNYEEHLDNSAQTVVQGPDLDATFEPCHQSDIPTDPFYQAIYTSNPDDSGMFDWIAWHYDQVFPDSDHIF